MKAFQFSEGAELVGLLSSLTKKGLLGGAALPLGAFSDELLSSSGLLVAMLVELAALTPMRYDDQAGIQWAPRARSEASSWVNPQCQE